MAVCLPGRCQRLQVCKYVAQDRESEPRSGRGEREALRAGAGRVERVSGTRSFRPLSKRVLLPLTIRSSSFVLGVTAFSRIIRKAHCSLSS